MRGRLRSGTEYDVFASFDLIHRRHSLDGSFHLRLPQDFPRRGIEGANLTIACASENQTTCRHHGANLRENANRCP